MEERYNSWIDWTVECNRVSWSVKRATSSSAMGPVHQCVSSSPGGGRRPHRPDDRKHHLETRAVVLNVRHETIAFTRFEGGMRLLRRAVCHRRFVAAFKLNPAGKGSASASPTGTLRSRLTSCSGPCC